MVDVLTPGMGFAPGVGVTIIPFFLTNRQEHMDARFQFYRDKAVALSDYLASVYETVGDLADLGFNAGVMAHTGEVGLKTTDQSKLLRA